MNTYGFILGRETDLCKAEIFSVLQNTNENYQILVNKKDVLIVSGLKTEIDINKLGGTIKLFDVIGEKIAKEKLQNFIQNNVEIAQSEKRINFGISGYGNIQANNIYSIGKKLKDRIVNEGLKARLVTGRFKDLSSVIVTENKLLERGFELIVVEDKGEFYIGQTIAVQDYKAYSKRDFGRTARDDRSGMLPPKLAQILINLAGTDATKSLYDPFCGSGTVLQEGYIMGFREIYGSDISDKAITDTKENLKWFLSSTIVPAETEETLNKLEKNIFQSDILSPTKQIKADLIVGEGFLGEPTRRNVETSKNDAKRLSDFYLKAFSNIARMLNEGGRATIALPYFIVGREKIFLPILEKLELTGLKQINFPNVNFTPRNTLLYSRPDSFVGREIFILEKI